MDNLITEYVRKFEEYPHFYFSGLDEDTLRAMLTQALSSGTPIEPQYVRGGVY